MEGGRWLVGFGRGFEYGGGEIWMESVLKVALGVLGALSESWTMKFMEM